MNRLHALAIAFALLAGSPRPTAGADGSSSAAPASTGPRVLETTPPPDRKSPPPKPDEWARGPEVLLARPLPEKCEARLVREWLRIRCRDLPPGSGALLSGAREGVSFWLQDLRRDPATFELRGERFVEIVLPLRKGDRRIAQLTASEVDEYSGAPFGHAVALIVSVQWLDDQKGPWVTVRGPNEPLAR